MFEQTTTVRLAGIAALALCLVAASGSARAQAPEPGFRGGEARTVGNVVGGGVATIIGGGDDMQIVYSGGGAGAGGDLAQPPRLARMTGGTGDGPEVEYLAPPSFHGGREAWIIGGGDDLRVVYTSPHAPAASRR